MRPRIRLRWAAMLLLPLLLGCDKRNERTLVVLGDLEVARDVGLSGLVQLDSRLQSTEIPESDFNASWNMITRGTQSAGGLAVTLSGSTEQTSSFVTLQAGVILVIPTPIAAGATYPIGETLIVGADALPRQWRFWGPRMLSTTGEAEFGMRVFDHHGIGMTIANDFIAQAATGTVEIRGRRGDQVDFRLDVTATDQLGRQVVIRGDFSIAPENYTPPIS